ECKLATPASRSCCFRTRSAAVERGGPLPMWRRQAVWQLRAPKGRGRCRLWRSRGARRPYALRPILMTSLSFILGVAPLAVATGAGAEMRQSLGTAVLLRPSVHARLLHLHPQA